MTGTVAEHHAVSFEGVKLRRKVRQDGKQVDLTVFDGIDLTVSRGQMVALVGPSGSGKTSLLRLVNRLDDADEGLIRVFGNDVRQVEVQSLRRRASLVLQKPVLFDGTVIDNINWPLELSGSRELDREAVAKLLVRVELEENLVTRDAGELSVGQQQRVCLARALALQPEILMLDETTSALDPPVATAVLSRLGEECRKGLTVFHITHEPSKLRMADRLLLLHDSRIAIDGPSSDLLDSPPDLLCEFLATECG